MDEVLLLLPVLGRGLGRPEREGLGEISERGIPVNAHLSPGHVQVLLALGRGPHSIRKLAGVVGVSSPAVTQLVNHLEEHKMVQRRYDPSYRRVVLVDYAPGMQEIARRMMEGHRRRLAEAVNPLTDKEARAFLKGLRLLVASFHVGKEGAGRGPYR